MECSHKSADDDSKVIGSYSLSQFRQDEEKKDNEEPANPSTSETPDVKSTAVVKYTTVEVPAMFTRLRCNTNLNLPPSNWLSRSAEPYGVQPALPGHRSAFSSFRMAHMFPDCVGAVDVVSDAENIKKLLKIPYSRGPVSMMVHRIENTLLIDDFDIHKYLLREAESQWKLFKKFFIDHMRQSVKTKQNVVAKDKSRTALQQKSLVSKFLYHSLVLADPEEGKKPEEPAKADPSVPIPLPYKNTEPPLPEPTLEEELPDPTSNHQFSRNVVWTFEDIQMLLGTDMPIFGGGTHPCISLRLRDMKKPINVLTGMDYWLDNLMCNVPEVVMCYHLNGIVQRYELIKTEDLPNLEDSKFSPKVVRDIAQNILSFLKANATKAGHTYWLFKGKDDDVVKLYDLSSLCTDTLDEKGQTPFTVPVAMLLYRVARNMKNSPEVHHPRHSATIRMLLKNCISLLSAVKYPQIVTSAHYMLADLYIPADINPAAPNISTGTEGEDEEDEGAKASDTETDSNLVKELCLSNLGEHDDEEEYDQPPPPLSADLETRCIEALAHVLEGLRSLRFISEPQQEAEPEMAKPYETIPMAYQSLDSTARKKQKKKKKCGKNEETKSLLCKPKAETVPTWRRNPGISWNVHLKILLYDKASLVYATKFERAYTSGKFGVALRNAGTMLKIQTVLRRIKTEDTGSSYLLGRVGDALLMVVQNSARTGVHHADEYEVAEDVDREVEEALRVEGAAETSTPLLPKSLGSLEEMLLLSAKCYHRALESGVAQGADEYGNLQRRLGNVENELGVFYMNKAAASEPSATSSPSQTEQTNKTSKKDFKHYFTESVKHLDAGLKAFEAVKDEANSALLHSNTGRLMRLRAHYHSGGTEMQGQEKHFYNKALASYQRALNVLGSRKDNPMVWDSVTWEMSTALFTMATVLQDYPSAAKSAEETEREVIEVLHRALKHCDVDTPGAKQPVYQFRCAMIHHRLAALYHRSYRNCTEEETRKKKLIQLCKLHYEKAARMLELLEHHSELLRVQLERVALAEYQAEGAASPSFKVRHLQAALELLLDCKPTLSALAEEDKEDSARSGETTVPESDDLKLLLLLKDRLQFVLLSLTKLSPQAGKTKESCEGFKALYASLIRSNTTSSNRAGKVAATLLQVLEKQTDLLHTS